MPIRLDHPLPTVPSDDETDMLEKLQGNILKGHGRKATALVLLRFDGERPDEARRFLAALGPRLTSARRQFDEAALYRQAVSRGEPPRTPPFLSCMLTAAGYAALGSAELPGDYAFRKGMKARAKNLSDRDPDIWEQTYRNVIHAMVMVGADPDDGNPDENAQMDGMLEFLQAMVAAHAVGIAGIERGNAYENADGHCMEHFGYIDGRSQPLFCEADIERERGERGGTSRWDPSYPLRHVLVRDPGVDDPNAFGSYFVYRKLEQNVRGFNTAIEWLTGRFNEIAGSKNHPVDREIVEAMIMGRFKDGRPLATHRNGDTHAVATNDFNYDDDLEGVLCPLHAHIRKTNPRGTAAMAGRETLPAERSHFFARRGVPYGARSLADGRFLDEPETGVGLLFLSCHADIRNQFEHVQNRWANDSHFPRLRTGVDPIVGMPGSIVQTHRLNNGEADLPAIQENIQGFVSLKGGDYFFTPSIPFFLAQAASGDVRDLRP